MDNNTTITVVSVHSPLIQYSSLGSYFTSYAISLKSNDPCFTSPYSQVRRRFSEFVQLRRMLQSHYPSIKPPVLPPKNYFYRFSDSFIEERKAGLQSFLEQVLSTPVYLSDKSLHLFLQSSSNMNKISEECLGDIPAPELMDFSSNLSYHSDTSSTASSSISDKVVSPKPNESSAMISNPETNKLSVQENERHLPSIDTKRQTDFLNCNSLPCIIPKRNGSLESSPASSLSSLDPNDCSSYDFKRRRVSFNQNVTVAVVYNHLWNIGTRPIRTDS